MTPEGYLALVLHAHLPYVRHPEHPEFLEERWLFEALTESYLPLLMVFEGLVRDGVDFRVTLSLTPTLTGMLEDTLLRERYRRFLDRQVDLAERESLRQIGFPERHGVAEFYRERFRALRAFYDDVLGGDVVAGFRRLRQARRIEILASAATHAVLPLLRLSSAAVRAQVHLGVENHQRLFGESPAGFWLPECGYYPGLDEVLAEEGVRYVVLEADAVLQGSTRPRYGVYAPVACPSGVAAFARDPAASRQVWSAEVGYPGHADYREFHRDIGFDLSLDYVGEAIAPDGVRVATGIKYDRVTDRRGGRKEPYHRERALARAAEHAADFLRGREEQVEALQEAMDRRPVIVAAYDAELLGHWWFEGPEWLDHLLRRMARGSSITTAAPSEYLAEYPQAQLSLPSLSTWGRGAAFGTWVNESTRWIYPALEQAAREMGDLALRHRGEEGERRRTLNQAARELLLAQASDWPFILHSRTATGYAERRLREHLDRFGTLAGWGRRGSGSLAPEEHKLLARWEDQNRIFPGLSFEVFLDGTRRRSWALPREPRRVAFLAAEAVPYVKVGGLADVVGALPPALAEAGLDALVVVPAYGSLDRERHGLRQAREGLQVFLGGKGEQFRLLEAPPSRGVRCLFVDHPGFFGREGIYTDPKGLEYPDSAERYIFFTRAALEALRALREPVDIVHCHDYHTALAPAFLKIHLAEDPILGRAASVLTIHNLGYQGECSLPAFLSTGLSTDPLRQGSPFEHWGKISPLKAGLVLADKISTVSEAYAREIQGDPTTGAGLQEVLRSRAADLVGILNGIDPGEWDPANDPHLPLRYTLETLEGKREVKQVLRERVGLSGDDSRPLAGMITRLVDQKGLDLVWDGLERLLGLGLDLVILGTGLPRYHQCFAEAARKHAGRLAVLLKFDNALAHLIEGGADLFLMPSLYEPCGLNQMYSLRYGTVPVVRRTGGLADTVVDDDAGGRGNGFDFVPYQVEAFLDAVERAVRAYGDPPRWRRIVQAGMQADHSWTASAGRYLDLYRDALEARDGSRPPG